MAEQLNTEPICIDAIADMDQQGEGGPVGGSNRFSRHMHQVQQSGQLVPFKADLQHYLSVKTPPEQHMAYATTWFVLTAALSFIAYRQTRTMAARMKHARTHPK